eukprot:671553-Rhodomonas_salina.1
MSDAMKLQITHDKWCHPSTSTALKNHTLWNGKGFPLDFRTQVGKEACRVCPLAKGARPYKHTPGFKAVGKQTVPVQRSGQVSVPGPDDAMITVDEGLSPIGMGADGA